MTDPISSLAEPFADEVGPVPGAPEASDLVGRFQKALKGYRLYLPNNQVLVGFIESFRDGLAVFLERYGDLGLRVSQFRISYEGATVYDNSVKEESLAFRFFIHGVREITFHEDVPEEEVTDFLRIIHRAFDAQTSVDDLLTMLWEREFEFITFIVIEDLFEEGEQAEFEDFVAQAKVREDCLTAAPHLANRPVLERAKSRGDREGTIELPSVELTEDERQRLALWVEEEKDRDLPRSLLAIVLEILGDLADPSDSIEILGVLNHLLDTLFEEGRIREAIHVCGELRRLGRQGGDAYSLIVERSLAHLDGERITRSVLAWYARCPTDERPGLIEFLNDRGAAAVTAVLGLLSDPELVEAATAILRELAESHLAVVIEGLVDPRPEIVIKVVRLLGEMGDIRALAHLRGPLSHEDVAIRRETVCSIGKLRSPAAVAALTEILEDPAPEVRVAAVRALGTLSSERAREPLLSLARSRDFRRRTYLEKKEVFLALGGFRDPALEAWLIGILARRTLFRRAERDELRACAVAALALLGTDSAWKAVRAREKDRSAKVRQAVAQALRPTD